MAGRRTKKKSDRLLKAAILLGILIGAGLVLRHPGIRHGINEVLLSSAAARIIPEPAVPPSSAKTVGHTVRKPRFGNLNYGVPGTADAIIEREGYALGYAEYHEQAAWVLYRLTGEQVSLKAVRRGNRFAEDPDIPTGSATPGDYRNSGFDRGHLAPAADMAYSPLTMKEGFYMSNISPPAAEVQPGDLEAARISGALFRRDGKGDLRGNGSRSARDEDGNRRPEQSDGADTFLQSRLRPDAAGEDDRLHRAQ